MIEFSRQICEDSLAGGSSWFCLKQNCTRAWNLEGTRSVSQTLQGVGGPRWRGRGTSVPEPSPGGSTQGRGQDPPAPAGPAPVQTPAQHTQASLPPSSARQDAAARRPERALVLTHIHDYRLLAGRISEATSLLYK